MQNMVGGLSQEERAGESLHFRNRNEETNEKQTEIETSG
jgi:hypothetical protein